MEHPDSQNNCPVQCQFCLAKQAIPFLISYSNTPLPLTVPSLSPLSNWCSHLLRCCNNPNLCISHLPNIPTQIPFFPKPYHSPSLQDIPTPSTSSNMGVFIEMQLMPWVPPNLHTGTQVLHRYSALALAGSIVQLLGADRTNCDVHFLWLVDQILLPTSFTVEVSPALTQLENLS